MRRRVDLLACCAALVAGLSGTAMAQDRCMAPATGEISDPPLHVTFDSWVVKREDGRFEFGRCVGTLNEQSVLVSWPLAQLNGEARPNAPLLIRMLFTMPTTTEQMAEMRYGKKRPPERSRDVTLLLNAVELGDIPEVSSQTDHVKQVMLASAVGGPQPDERELVLFTRASTSFDENEVPRTLTAIIESRLEPKSIVEYRIDVRLPGGVTTAATLRPQSEYMRYVFATALDRETLSLADGRISTVFGSPSQLQDMLYEGVLTQRIDTMDVVLNGEVVASFPYAVHAPTGAIPGR